MRKIIKSLFLIVVGISGFLFQTANAGISISDSQQSFNTHLQNRNSITGFIFDESRRPVSEVYVELLNDVYSTIYQTKTSGSGLYSFRGLPDGQYSVRVSPYGKNYEPQTRSVSLISISALGGTGSISEQVDFYLKAKRNMNSGPLAAPGVVFAQDVPKDAEKLFEDGVGDLSGNKEKEGFEKLKRAIEIFPKYFLALDRLGTEYVVRGYYEAAYMLLTKAVEVNPRSFSSRFGLGLSQFRLQQIDEAISNLKQAAEIYNESVNVHMWLGIALHGKGKLDEALTALLRADKLGKGKTAEVHWQLARVYKDQKRYTDAANELELFLKYKTDAKNADQIKETIKVLRQKGNTQE